MSVFSFDDEEDNSQNTSGITAEEAAQNAVPDYIIDQAIEVPWEIPNELEKYDTDIHSASEIIAASFREGNAAYLAKQAYDIGRLGNGETDPDFNLDAALKEEGIQDTFGYFSDVKNQDQFYKALDYHYEHLEDQKILSDTPIAKRLTLGLVAGIADPINYIPVARALKWGTTAVRAGIEGAVLGGIGSGIASKVYKDLSPTDVAIDVVASGLCSALLGHLATENTRASLKAGLKETLTGHVKLDDMISIEEILGYKESLQRKARNFFIYPTPQLQAQNSKDPTIKKIAPYISYGRQLMAPDTYSVQEGLNVFNLKFSKWHNELTQNKLDYIKKQKDLGINPELAEKEWETEAKRALITWLDNPIGEMPNHSGIKRLLEIGKECIDKAKQYDVLSDDFTTLVTRKKNLILTREIYEGTDDFLQLIADINSGDLSKINFSLPLKEAIADQFFKTTTANNYFPRVYSIEKLRQNGEYYYDLLTKSLRLNNPKMSDKKISKLASKMLADMSGEGLKNKTPDIQGITNVLRTVAISDELLFQSFDLDACIDSYYRSLRRITAATELNIVAKNIGFKTWEALENKYAEVVNIKLGENIIEGKNVSKQMDSVRDNHKLLTDIRLLYMGDFTKTDTFANNRLLKAANETIYLQYAWQLGSTLIRSLNDVAIDVFHFGFLRTGKNLATFFVKDRQARRDVLFNLSFVERLKENSFRFFQESDEVLSPFKKATKKIADWENKLSLQYYWDRGLRKTALEELYSDTIKIAYKVGDNLDLSKLDKREKEFFKAVGLTEDHVMEIREAFEKYGENYLGIAYVDPIHLSSATANHLGIVLRTLTDEIVLSPSITNVPIWTRTELGRMLHHYVNYGFMVYENVFLPMVRGKYGVSRVAQGIAASLSLTALAEWLYNCSNGKDTDWEDKETWKNIVTGSHLLNPIIWAVDRGWDILKQGGYAVSERLFPVASWLSNTANAIRNLISGDIEKININKFPGLNLWEVKMLKRLGENL